MYTLSPRLAVLNDRERERKGGREKCQGIIFDCPGIPEIGTSLKDQSAATASRRTVAVKSFLRSSSLFEVPFPASCIDFRELSEPKYPRERERERERERVKNFRILRHFQDDASDVQDYANDYANNSSLSGDEERGLSSIVHLIK